MLVLLVLLIPCACSQYTDDFVHKPGMCITQGQCNGSIPCAVHPTTNNTISPEGEHRVMLHKICPMYKDEPQVCCTIDQLEEFDSMIAVVKSVIGGCEACLWNFRLLQCAWFCDANQYKHLQIAETRLMEDSTKLEATKIRYFISKQFATRIFNSCKDVRASIGGLAIANICEKADCSLEEFYAKLGDNRYISLKTEIVINDNPGVSYVSPVTDEHVYDCDDAVNGRTCSCHDCEQMDCPAEIESVRYDKYTIPAGAALSAILVAAIVVATACSGGDKEADAKKEEEIEIPAVGIDNKAAEITSPNLSLRDDNEDEQNKSNGDAHKDGGDVGKANGDPQTPYILPLSPQLSVGSTLSPTTAENNEAASLIGQKRPRYECWLENAPRLAEAWSNFVFHNYLLVIAICVVVIGICSGGWYNFRITYDTVELWTADDSISRQNQKDYNASFSNPYRAAQMVLKEESPTTFSAKGRFLSGVFKAEFLKEAFNMMEDVIAIEGKNGETYEDLCYKPLGEFNKTHPLMDCALMTIFQWMKNNKTLLDNPEVYVDRLELCPDSVLSSLCIGSFRGPVSASTVLGGYDDVSRNYLQSTSIILTFALDGSLAKKKGVLAWEKAFSEYISKKMENGNNMIVMYSTDRALNDEIEAVSHADIMTIVISYIMMFVYVGVTLGDFFLSVKGCLLYSKALVGMSGVVIVILSVVSALGVTSWANLPSTLIVLEVIPFLILAVGVDNVYVLVQGIQRIITEKLERNESIQPNQVKGILAKTMNQVFPSMILSSFSQMVAFALGSLSFMPSVQNFAYNATLALLMNFLLQSSLFLIVLRFDLMRQVKQRLDIVCCVKIDKVEKPLRGPTRWFIEDYWNHLVFKSKWVPSMIVAIFGVITIFHAVLIPNMDIGLDATTALSEDSPLRKYYDTVFNDYRIGPSVSFVFKPRKGDFLDIFDPKIYGQLVSNRNSLSRIMSKYGDDPEIDYIKGSGRSFLKAFERRWLTTPACCWLNQNNEFCSSINNRTGCQKCDIASATRTQRYTYLQWFIQDIPRVDGSGCTSGGAVSYAYTANFKKNSAGETIGVSSGRFSSSHGPLRKSVDFINARYQARQLADEVNMNNEDIEVYAYSSFYPYYEQYDTIVRDLAMNIALCVVATFLVSLTLLGFNLHAALCILLAVSMSTIDMMGSMYYLGISLNAVSVVNLLMSIGIAVEFSSHIVQAFIASPAKDRRSRAKDALLRTGPAIISGIAMTNFVGILILAAAKSQMFVVFYFRMFFAVNCVCLIHTIVFLPAFLGFLG